MSTGENRQKLVLDNMRLAYSVAQRYRGCGLEMKDIQSIAMLGLVKAAELFDESRGLKFATLAVPVMQNDIRHEIRKNGKHYKCTSLEKPIVFSEGSERSCTLADIIPYEEAGFQAAEHLDLIASLLEIPSLKENERKSIILVVCKGMSQEEAGFQIGLSQSVVSRYVRSGIKKIREVYWG